MAETPLAYDSPVDRFLTYVNLNVGTGLIASVRVPTANLPPDLITYSASATAGNQTTINDIAFTTPTVFGGWVALPVPNYSGFRHDVITDASAANFPFALLMAMLISDPSLSYSDRKAFAVKCTSWITAAYPTQASAILSGINAYAINRNLPLT